MNNYEALCKWYIDNRVNLMQAYLNKIVLISNSSVQGVYVNYREAYIVGQREYGMGNFIIETVQEESEQTVCLY